MSKHAYSDECLCAACADVRVRFALVNERPAGAKAIASYGLPSQQPQPPCKGCGAAGHYRPHMILHAVMCPVAIEEAARLCLAREALMAQILGDGKTAEQRELEAAREHRFCVRPAVKVYGDRSEAVAARIVALKAHAATFAGQRERMKQEHAPTTAAPAKIKKYAPRKPKK